MKYNERQVITMSSGSYKAVDCKCPFFKYDDGKRRITCEGLVGEGSSIALIYHNKADYEIQMNTFCCKHYEKCEVYRLLMDIFENSQ